MATLARYPHPFLPTTREEMEARGWDELDILIVNGDAYVDHPAFGPALIGRFLEGRGFRVGIIAQPTGDSAEPFARWARRGSSSASPPGNLDSMLNKLTAQKKMRSRGSVLARRAARAAGRTAPPSSTPTSAARRSRACRSCSAASRRRCGASRTTTTGATRCAARCCSTRRPICSSSAWASGPCGRSPSGCARASASTRSATCAAPRTCMRNDAEMKALEADPARTWRDGKTVVLPTYEEVIADKQARSRRCRAPSSTRPTRATGGRCCSRTATRPSTSTRRRCRSTTARTMDELYDLPFTRVPHPSYTERDPRLRDGEALASCTMRGCFGGCTFCSITEHEGRVIQSRSAESVLREVRALRRMDDFRGTITRPRRADRQHVQDEVQERGRSRARAGGSRACTRASARTW